MGRRDWQRLRAVATIVIGVSILPGSRGRGWAAVRIGAVIANWVAIVGFVATRDEGQGKT